MAIVRYHKYVGELWQDLDLEDLVDELSDFFLQSGFGQEVDEWDEDSLQSLHDAILDAVLRRGLLSEEDLQKLMAEMDIIATQHAFPGVEVEMAHHHNRVDIEHGPIHFAIREDQLQRLAWKFMIPLALVNIAATAVLKVVF